MKIILLALLASLLLSGCETTGTVKYDTFYYSDYYGYDPYYGYYGSRFNRHSYYYYRHYPPYTGMGYKQHRGDRAIRPPYTGEVNRQDSSTITD